MRSITFCLLLAVPGFGQGVPKSIHPAVNRVVSESSEERIAATMKKLESFGTRLTASEAAKAARAWIVEEMKSYSPRLQVRQDAWVVKQMPRMTGEVEVTNVVAVLPGKTLPETQVVLASHYDTVAVRGAAQAPGVVDDASGVATMMELARVMSQYEFDKTLVFVSFEAEEQGLVGATLHAEKALKEKQAIEAVLNDDIMGGDSSGNGFRSTHAVRVFSDEPMDSGSRALARYIKETGERYVPEMKVDLVFRRDRFSRGGDHTPFHARGFAAVRFTTPAENYQNQHGPGDNFENASPAYAARVTRVNAAAAASLALAPKAPVVRGLGRGTTQYDAVARWEADANAAGYALVIRSTLAPYWEREIYVGKVAEYTLKNFSIDDVVIGVKAYNTEGLESLVSAYGFSGMGSARNYEAVEKR
jgi:hypothetical protein